MAVLEAVVEVGIGAEVFAAWRVVVEFVAIDALSVDHLACHSSV